MEEKVITVHKEQVFRYWEEKDKNTESAMSDKTFVYIDDKYHLLVPVKDITGPEKDTYRVRVFPENQSDGKIQVTAKMGPGEYFTMLLSLQEVCDRACGFRDRIAGIIAGMNQFGYEIKDSIVPMDTMWTLKDGVRSEDVPISLSRMQHRTWNELGELLKEAQNIQKCKERLLGNLPEMQNALIAKLFCCLPISQEEWKSVTGRTFDNRFFLDAIIEQWNRCNTEQGKYLVATSNDKFEFGLEEHYLAGERVSSEDLKRDMEKRKAEQEQSVETPGIRKRGRCL